jgi:hypothetical protein
LFDNVSIASARRIVFVVHAFSAVLALVLTPIIVIVMFLILWDTASPSDIFCGLRRFFIRILSGHALRPFTLHMSLPRGTSVRGSSDTPI